MENRKTAEKITLVITDISIFLFLFLSVLCRRVVEWYVNFRQFVMTELELNLCFVMSLLSGISAIILLMAIHSMLYNVIKSRIFIPKNALCFKIVSLCSFVICLAFLVILIKCRVFIGLVVVLVFMFVGLISYIIFKFMENAIKIKEENDYTI